MQTIKTKWEEAQNSINTQENPSESITHSDSFEATFGSSTTRSSSIAKTSSTSSVQSEGVLLNINNLVSNSSSASSISMNQLHQESIIKEKIPLVCSADGKPIAAPRIKKIGGSSAIDGLSHQLSQLRRIYEAAELESLENELVDNEVQLYLGGEFEVDNEVEPSADKVNTEVSGSWSRVRAKRIMMEQKGGIFC